MAGKDLCEKGICEKSEGGEGERHVYVSEKSTPGRGNGKCKGPEAGVDLICGGPVRRLL